MYFVAKHPIQIRQAKPEDAATVAQLLHSAFIEFRSLYTPEGFAATALTPEQVLTRFSEGPVWLVHRDSTALGTVAAVPNGLSIYMRGMGVPPSARGIGVGSLLLEKVELWTTAKGCSRIFLSTTPFLHTAIRLYEKHNFRRIDVEPQDLFGTPLFTMEKILVSNES